MNQAAQAVVNLLGLEPLPGEGGFCRQMWRSPEQTASGRVAGTAAFFLLTAEDFSALHRLGADEVYWFLLGDEVELTLLAPDGHGKSISLGRNLHQGQQLLAVAPAGVWQGSRLASGKVREGFALVGCSMVPGWTEEDFALGDRAALLAAWPEWVDQVRALTR